MKVTLLTRSLSEGGAARAASRWTETINCEQIIEEQGLFKYKIGQVLKKIENLVFRKWDSGTYGPTSISFYSSINLRKLKSGFPTTYFVHWVQSNFLSLYRLYRISPHTIFYAHDEWLLTNLGHYLPMDESFQKNLPKGVIQKFKRAYILKRCICVVTPSNWLKDKFLKNSPNSRVHVIPNPMQKLFLEPVEFRKTREKYGFESRAKIALMISDANFYDPRKGMQIGLEIFSAAQKIVPELQLLFVGRAPKDTFSNISNVHNWGFVQDDNVLREAYALANCTLVPSKIDNFPQTSTESQSTGTPVILFDTGGCAETILDPNLSGHVIPLGNINKFVESLVYFSNIDLAQHLINRTLIQSLARLKWSPEEIKKQFQEVLQKMIYK